MRVTSGNMIGMQCPPATTDTNIREGSLAGLVYREFQVDVHQRRSHAPSLPHRGCGCSIREGGINGRFFAKLLPNFCVKARNSALPTKIPN